MIAITRPTARTQNDAENDLAEHGRSGDHRDLLPGRARDDCVGSRPQFSFGKSRVAGAARMGWIFVSIWNPSGALVLDRRNPRDALSRHRDDAVLLHLENSFGY